MKFGIWRHENSIGNSVEHTMGLAVYLTVNKIDPANVEVYVENDWQKDFVLCIQGIQEKNVKFFERPVEMDTKDPYFDDIHMPNVYGPTAFPLSYECDWNYLDKHKELNVSLKFDDSDYENKFNLPKDAVVLFCREHGTWWKREDGSEFEPERFVDPETFHDLAHYYANKGYKVIKIGDAKQKRLRGNYTPFEFGERYEHENLIDFTKYLDEDGNPRWTLKDYLFILQNCKVFISCDAGIWPMAAAMNKNLVFCNVMCILYPITLKPLSDGAKLSDDGLTIEFTKPNMVTWMPRKTTRVLLKHATIDTDKLKRVEEDSGTYKIFSTDVIFSDNTFTEILTATETLI